MHSLRHVVFALLAALALTTSQVVPVLHVLGHERHHAAAAHVGSVAEDHRSDVAAVENANDHESLRCSACARLANGHIDLPVCALIVMIAANVRSEPDGPPRDVTRVVPRLYVAALPEQPRAPPAG